VRRGLICLSLLVGFLLPAGYAAAGESKPPARSSGIGVRLVAPAGVRDDLRASSWIVERLVPGTRARRRIEIINDTRSTQNVSVYPAAAGLREGGFRFAAGDSQNELTGWTSLTRDALRLRPGTSAFETVTINIPKRASSGKRYGVIWAAVSAPGAGAITLVNRVGIRMYVTVALGSGRSANFAIGTIGAERSDTGAPLVVAEIRNSGGRALDISGTLTLANGPGGLRAGPFPVRLGRALAPDGSEPLTMRLDKELPRGPWQVHLELRSGSLRRVAVASVTFPPVVPAGSRHPILIASLLSLLAVAAFALLLSRRGAQLRRQVHPSRAT
jgi:hypothetical protein